MKNIDEKQNALYCVYDRETKCKFYGNREECFDYVESHKQAEIVNGFSIVLHLPT